jgi:hypothetical protein
MAERCWFLPGFAQIRFPFLKETSNVSARHHKKNIKQIDYFSSENTPLYGTPLLSVELIRSVPDPRPFDTDPDPWVPM